MPNAVAPSDTSPVIMTELVLPSHTNALGTIFGGVVMGWVDIAGAIAAQRFCRSPVVTVSIDYLHFIVPIKTGYTVRITARVSYAGTTSMETEVLVDAENSITGEVRRATNAFLTYVAIDEFGRPKKVPALPVKTAAEKKAFAEAKARRERRLQWIHKPEKKLKKR
jgi:acyl-CoA hydrolase